MVIFDGEQPFESFYLKHFDTLQDLQNCTECFKNLSIYSSSIYYQTSQSNTGSFKRILTENDEWLDVTFWKNGGNYFTSSFILGTLNTNELNFITSGSKRLTISSFGNVQISKSVNIDENLTISGSTTILSTLYDSLLEAGSTNQFLKSNNLSGSQWTTIQMSHVSGLLNYTSSISSSFVDINNSLNNYTSSNNVSINNLNQVSASFKTFTSSLNIWTGSFSSSVNTQFSNINTSLTGLNTFSSSINSLTSSYFRQGGNSFGTSALLGTNDNQPLNFETSGSIRINISTLGDVVVFKGFEVKQNLLVRGSTFLYSALYDSNISAGSSTQFLRSVSTNGTVWTDIQMSHVSGLLNYTSSISSSLNSLNSYTSSNNTVLNNFSVYTSSLNTATGSFFRQGGNSFGTSGSIGTLDNNNLHIITSGSTRLTISSVGNVGIGTTSPINILHIKTSNPIIRLEGLTTSGFIDFDDTRMDVHAGNGYMSLIAGTTEKVRIGANGNVLIGTSTDIGYKLDVNGTLRNTTSAYFATTSGNVGIGTVTANQKLEVSSAGATSIRINNTLANTWDITNSAPSGELHFTRGGSNTYIRIDNAGNMGLGISPITKLHISGSQINESPSGVNLTLYNSSDSNRNGYISVTGDGDFSNRFVNIGSNSTAYGFKILNGATEFVRIINNGNFGIGGIPNNSAKLDINSTTSGVLFPRMTTTQKNAITGVAGLVVYDTTLSKLQIYTTTWENLH